MKFIVSGDIICGAFTTTVEAASPEAAQALVEGMQINELDAASSESHSPRVDSVEEVAA